MSEKLLTIEDLWVHYKTADAIISAINGISFSIGKGETMGLVGETGAGKTTTALSILRLLPNKVGVIDKGRIRFKETDLTNASESTLRKIRGEAISMIFQDPMTSLNPVTPVGKQIEEVMYLHLKQGREDIKAKTGDMLELVGIPRKRAGDYPHQFSGGMKQRVVIAMALACNPELLIADEPTTALDVTIQAQVLEMMNELKIKLGTSMILITHDLGIVAEMCDTVAIMYAGEI